MSYVVLFFLIIGGYVLGAPIFRESLRFHLVECIPDENQTSKHVLEITDFNETCVRVNKSSPAGNEVYLYIIPQTENGAQFHIITENCSTPLPDLHLSLCDDDDDETNDNSTEIMVTYEFSNISNIDTLNNNDTTTIKTFTGSTVYETLHQLDQNSDEEDNNITNAPPINAKEVVEKSDQSSESDGL